MNMLYVSLYEVMLIRSFFAINTWSSSAGERCLGISKDPRRSGLNGIGVSL